MEKKQEHLKNEKYKHEQDEKYSNNKYKMIPKKNFVLIGSLPMSYVYHQINLNVARIGITTKITPPKTFTCKIINLFYLTYPHHKSYKA
jgi:hypothetical protein